MFKGFKKLFVYKKPPEDIDGFELLEDRQESALWSQYRGNEENLKKNGQQQDSQQQNAQEPQDSQAQQDNQNQSGDKNKKPKDDVSSKLMKMLQGSQSQQQNQSNGKDSVPAAKGADVSSRLIQIMKNAHDGNVQNATSPGKSNTSNQKHASEKLSENGGKNRRRHNDKSGKVITPLAIKEILKNSASGDESNGKEQSDRNDNKEAGGKKQGHEQPDESQQNRENAGAGESDTQNQENESGGSQQSGLASKLSEIVRNYETKMTPGNLEYSDNNSSSSENKKEGDDQGSDSGKKDNQKDECGNYHDNGIPECISSSLHQNKQYLEQIFHLPHNQDIIIREFNVAREIPAFLVFVDGMIDKNVVIEFTLPQLMDVHPFSHYKGGCPIEYIEKNVISINQIVRMKKFKEIVQQILNGLTAVFVDGCDEVLVLESRGFEKRGIQAPVTETVVQGAQEGFTENLRTNITLVRRIVKNENLVTEINPVSKTNNFQCALLYMEGLTNPKLVKEVKRRIENLDVDYITGSGMLHQLIEDKPSMLFPQLISTERPDRVASFLMEGKVVLICEGTPFALAMPITFFDLFHTSEEANLRWQYGSFISLVRIIGLLLAAFFPGMYMSLILYHQEMIPTSLLASIVVSRSPVPFPSIVELLLMEFAFELIREGGIRVPGVIGNTLGIIGALILGQAAVEAGLVSPILIIVVAVSGLGSFAIPNNSLSLAVRIMRFLLIFSGYIAGFYGVSAAFTILCGLALSMKSFGVPFFAPIAPTTRSNTDKIIRGPIYRHIYRPDFAQPLNRKRMGDNPRGWAKENKGGVTDSAQGR